MYALRRTALENVISRTILEEEAKKRGVSVEELKKLLTTGKIEILQSEVDQVYAENIRGFENMGQDEAKERIRLNLESQARIKNYKAALADLRNRTNVEILLPEPLPPIVNVDDSGYSLGSRSATVSLDSKTRTYKALVIFHNPYGTTEDPKPEFWDTVVGMGGSITGVFKEQRVPFGAHKRSAKESNTAENRAPLQEGVTTNSNAVDGEITSPSSEDTDNLDGRSRHDSNNPTQNRQHGKGQVQPNYLSMCADDPCDCSDPNNEWSWDRAQCWGPVYGPPSGGGGGGGGNGCTASASSVHPIQNASDNKYHSSNGKHWAQTQFSAGCTVDTSCMQLCQVLIDGKFYGDDHDDTTEYFYTYHVGGGKPDTQTASGTKGTQITCGGGVGYAFNECASEGCAVNVEVGWSGTGASAKITSSGGDLWTVGQSHVQTCQ